MRAEGRRKSHPAAYGLQRTGSLNERSVALFCHESCADCSVLFSGSGVDLDEVMAV